MTMSELSQEGAGQAPTTLAKLMIDPAALSFPFRGPVHNGESGQSYALRMAEENGLSGLPPLKSWLGKSRFAVLDSADAPMLRRWFGANENMLEFALGRTATGRRDAAYVYAGQTLGRSYFLNRTYPRVCPECLTERGHCLIAWDMSLVVACPQHHRVLMDRCDYCQRALSWNRLRVGTCSCGMELAMSEPSQASTGLENQFATWVAQRISRSSCNSDESHSVTHALEVAMPGSQGLTALMTLLWPLSLDGGFRIAYAMGTAAGYSQNRPDPLPRPKTPLKKAHQMLSAANDLAEKIARLESVHFRVSRPSVVVQLLAELASTQVKSPERSLAHSILVFVLNRKIRTTLSGQNPHLAQLPLF